VKSCWHCKKDTVFYKRLEMVNPNDKSVTEYDLYLCADHPACPGRAVDNITYNGKQVNL
jgi:hypothetical protein